MSAESNIILIQRDNNKDTEKYEVDLDTLNSIDIALHRKTLTSLVKEAILARGALDGSIEKAECWLTSAIMSLGSVEEIKVFTDKYKDPGAGFLSIGQLTTHTSEPSNINTIIEDPFARKLFNSLFLKPPAGKSDSGPGETALVFLSPDVSYVLKGDVLINNVGKIEIKASRTPKGKGGRVWDSPINQLDMYNILKEIFPSTTDTSTFTVSVLDKKHKIIPQIIKNDPSKKFITAACNAWFGTPIDEVINAFGTPEFKNIWHKHIFNTYKAKKQFVGLLAIGRTTYQYIQTGEQFAAAKKASSGYLCKILSSDFRALVPQVLVK